MANRRPSRAKGRITGQSGTGTMTISGTGDSSLKTFVQALGGSATYMVEYVISGTNVYEEGVGLFTASGTTLTRPSGNVVASSNGGSLLSLSSGATYDVIIVMRADGWFVDTGTADRTLSVKDNGNVQQLTGSTARTLNLPALSGVPDPFRVPVENASTALWTLDGAGSEPIREGSRSAQTLALLPGDAGVLFVDHDRAAWRFVYSINPANAGAHGQCRLTSSGGNLLLSPHNGNGIKINGRVYLIPFAGVSYTPSGLTPGQLYYVYASISAGAIVLSLWTTAPESDPTVGNVGVLRQTGDSNYTLVGMCRATGASTIPDSLTQRFVLSYFNRRNLALRNFITADRSITAGSYTEFHSEIRCEFLTWFDESVHGSACGVAEASGTGTGFIGVGLDGAAPSSTVDVNSQSAAQFTTPFVAAPSQGYHYVTLMGKSNGTNTLKLEHFPSGDAVSLVATIRG